MSEQLLNLVNDEGLYILGDTVYDRRGNVVGLVEDVLKEYEEEYRGMIYEEEQRKAKEQKYATL